MDCRGSSERRESFPPGAGPPAAAAAAGCSVLVLGTCRLEPPCRGISFLAQGACSRPSSAGRGGERSAAAGTSLGKLAHHLGRESRGAGKDRRTVPLKTISRLC